MSKSECPKCGPTSFEASGEGIENINTQMAIIRCKSCKTAIGVVDTATSNRVKELLDLVKGHNR